jgi:hypothetical protein
MNQNSDLIEAVRVDEDFEVDFDKCVPYTVEMYEKTLYLLLPRGFPTYNEISNMITLDRISYHLLLTGVNNFFYDDNPPPTHELILPLVNADDEQIYNHLYQLFSNIELPHTVRYDLTKSGLVIVFPQLAQ